MTGILGRGRLGKDRVTVMVAALACTGFGATLVPVTAFAQLPEPLPEAAKAATRTATTVAGRLDDTAGGTGLPAPGGLPSVKEGIGGAADQAVDKVAGDAGDKHKDIAPATGGEPTRASAPVPRRQVGRAAPIGNHASAAPRRPSPAVVADGASARRPAALGTDARPRRSPIAPVADTGSADSESRGAIGRVVGDVADSVGSVVEHLPDWSRPIIAVLLALVLLFGARTYFSDRHARRLERARRALSADVDVLQAALVPALPERIGGVELSVAYRPADGLASGGDFYDVFALDEHRTALILGDVSGHDRAAIARAAAVRHKLRAYLELGLEPRMVLHAAGEAMAGDSADGAFATAVVAVHDAEAGTLTYACAGHEPPILTGGAAHEPVTVCSSAPLGWGLPTGRRQTTVVLGDRDCACFFTDGFIEARCNGDFLGRDGLERLVVGLGATGTAGDLVDDATELARAFADDLAVLVIRTPAAAAVRSMRVEEVELDGADLSRHAAERFLSSCAAPVRLIEELAESAQAAVDEGDRAVVRVRFGAQTGELDALVEPVHPARTARALAV